MSKSPRNGKSIRLLAKVIAKVREEVREVVESRLLGLTAHFTEFGFYFE